MKRASTHLPQPAAPKKKKLSPVDPKQRTLSFLPHAPIPATPSHEHDTLSERQDRGNRSSLPVSVSTLSSSTFSSQSSKSFPASSTSIASTAITSHQSSTSISNISVPLVLESKFKSHLPKVLDIILSPDFHRRFGCRNIVREYIKEYGHDTTYHTSLKLFETGFDSLLSQASSDWCDKIADHLTPLDVSIHGHEIGVYVNVVSLPSDSEFFQDQPKLEQLAPVQPNPNTQHVSMAYYGSTTVSFRKRVFKQHESATIRKCSPSFHYSAMDASDAKHQFFLVAKVGPETNPALLYILEATAIAAANTCGKFGSEFTEYFSQRSALPKVLSRPWGLNRTHALLDFYGDLDAGESQLSSEQLSDMVVTSIVKRGGVDGKIEEKITAQRSQLGSVNAAKAKSANVFSEMIQTGRLVDRNQRFNLGGHKIVWGKDCLGNINKSEQRLRLWISFSEDGNRHPHAWVKDNSRPELQIFGLKAEGPNTVEVGWVTNQIKKAGATSEVAGRIVGQSWRRADALRGMAVAQSKKRGHVKKKRVYGPLKHKDEKRDEDEDDLGEDEEDETEEDFDHEDL